MPELSDATRQVLEYVFGPEVKECAPPFIQQRQVLFQDPAEAEVAARNLVLSYVATGAPAGKLAPLGWQAWCASAGCGIAAIEVSLPRPRGRVGRPPKVRCP